MMNCPIGYLNKVSKRSIITTVLLSLNLFSLAQVSPSSELYQQIHQMDSLLFEEGFNRCNFSHYENILAQDLEFYHDQGGMQSRKEFITSTRQNICGNPDRKPLRKLVKRSMNVFPLKSQGELYGAIQEGEHHFYIKEPGKEPYPTGAAKFSNLYVLEDEKWKLKRVLSYAHKALEAAEDLSSEKKYPGDIKKIETYLKENKVPVLGIGVINRGEIKQLGVYGTLEREVEAPFNTIFNVASLTKPIVTMLTLKLVNNGDWSLDEPVYHYWTDPDVQNDEQNRTITTRHLLSHQSGFPNWRTENPENLLKINFTPGTDFNYSGEGYEYLQKALENKFQTGIEELADSILFRPLQMKETSFVWKPSTEEAHFAKWYGTDGEQLAVPYIHDSASAADNLLTTIEDYTRFALYILEGGGISEELFAEMTSPQNQKENPIKMGLGWELLPNLENDQFAVLHTGSDVGVNTLIILLPATGEGLVIFTNGDNGKNLYAPLIKKYLSLGKEILSRG